MDGTDHRAGNIAFNKKKGRCAECTFNIPRPPETKLVRCNRGAILDINRGLRPESPTYLTVAVELTAQQLPVLYVPERFGHGYQVLEDRTETELSGGEFYTPGAEGGLLTAIHARARLASSVGEICAQGCQSAAARQDRPELKRRMSASGYK